MEEIHDQIEGDEQNQDYIIEGIQSSLNLQNEL